MVETLVLGQTRQRFEDSIIVRVVGVVLDLSQREELWPGRRVARRLSEVDFSGRLGEGDGVVEGRVGARVGHGEARAGLEHAGLEGGKCTGCLGRHCRVRTEGGGLGRVWPAVAVVTEVLSHLVVARVEAARIIVPGVGQSLIHQLVAVSVSVHLRPVVVRRGREAAQSSHSRGRVGRPRGHNGRSLVRSV